MKKSKLRADELLLSLDLCESRTQAKALILGGKVWLGTERVDKPGRILPEDAPIRVDAPPPFVGRGGEKLSGFLKEFPLQVDGLDILDVGASTGGFTDCLLKAGARSATCVDVGYGQLHYSLRQDERVTNLERTNARNLAPSELPLHEYPLIVMDLSFISLRKVLPAIWNLLSDDGHLIALVKPQFEATKQEADRGKGIIRDDAVHTRILSEIKDFAKNKLANAEISAETKSIIKGTNGNTEYFLGWKKPNKILRDTK